jgi:hypothetical protein
MYMKKILRVDVIKENNGDKGVYIQSLHVGNSGIRLTAPNGDSYKLDVDNDGNLILIKL